MVGDAACRGLVLVAVLLIAVAAMVAEPPKGALPPTGPGVESPSR